MPIRPGSKSQVFGVKYNSISLNSWRKFFQAPFQHHFFNANGFEILRLKGKFHTYYGACNKALAFISSLNCINDRCGCSEQTDGYGSGIRTGLCANDEVCSSIVLSADIICPDPSDASRYGLTQVFFRATVRQRN